LKEVVLIGYSGHGHVAHDIFDMMGIKVAGYCDLEEKEDNYANLLYFGKETDISVLEILKDYDCFVSIGDNIIRERTSRYLLNNDIGLTNAIHPSSVVSSSATLGKGLMVGPNTTINSHAAIKDGSICNSASVVEHGCQVGEYSHIAPGVVLCGGVTIGSLTLIGAASVVLFNICVGAYVIVGAGTIVISNVSDNQKVVGNPQRVI